MAQRMNPISLYRQQTTPIYSMNPEQSIIDQLSPLKELNSNRQSAAIVRTSARSIPQLVSTRAQPTKSVLSPMEMSPIHKALQLLNQILIQIKLTNNKLLESQIDTIISILRSTIFDKENNNPNVQDQLKSQIIGLQQNNEQLLNQKKQFNNQIQHMENKISQLSIQMNQIINQRDNLQKELELLQVKLLAKEQQFVDQLTKRTLPNDEYSDLKWRYEQSIIAYQRKDKDCLIKTEEIQKLKETIQFLDNKNKDLEIKMMNILSQEVQKYILHQQ